MGINLSEKQIEILEERTEGWIAGLQLAALSLKKNQNPAKFVDVFRGTHRHVLDYLLEEVLNGQTGDVRKFLRQTSILEQLSPSLCEAVTGQKDSAGLLRYLESNNLFLVPLDENRTWYRYHALFGELLKNQLSQTEPDSLDELHKRVAGWHRENGYIHKAVEHASQISERGLALELIEAYAIPMLYQGEVSTVVAWFDRLPEPLLRSSPMMNIGKAWSLALMQRGTRRGEVDRALQDAESALDLIGADEALRNLVLGHAASIQALLMQAPVLAGEKPEKLIETSQRAQQLLPAEEKAIRSVNFLNIGYGYMALADLPAAEAAFEQTLEEGLAGGNLYAAVYGPIGLILIAILEGRLGDALQLCETNIRRFDKILAGQRFPPIGALHILMGSLLLEQNRLAEAEGSLTQGMRLVRWTGEYEAHMKGFTALARLRAIQGDWPDMLENIKTLEETWPEGAIYAQALRHRLSLRYLAESESEPEGAHAWLARSGIAFDSLPETDSVDPLSEAYFQTYLSGVHILAHLAKQNPRAYPCQEAHDYLERQREFAERRGLVNWLIGIGIARALLYQVTGKTDEARAMILAALKASAQRGYFRTFVDEGGPMRSLLEGVRPHLTGSLVAYADHLLAALGSESADGETGKAGGEILSKREVEVLRCLAAGLTYNDIAEQLIICVNTVRYHVKGLYGKLGVSSRADAIASAREMNLL
jgi:LuxR family maltose regulon positive regulatory protein